MRGHGSHIEAFQSAISVLDSLVSFQESAELERDLVTFQTPSSISAKPTHFAAQTSET